MQTRYLWPHHRSTDEVCDTAIVSHLPSDLPTQLRNMAAEIEVRATRESDLLAIAEIHKYYVLNTVALSNHAFCCSVADSRPQVLTFVEEPHDLDYFVSAHRSIAAQKLPHIVAVDQSSSTVLGYVYAQGFRGTKGAYKHTVEITLFCHPDHQNKGVGSKLLTSLLCTLRERKEPPVRQVLAVMAVDEAGKGHGLALRTFYEKFGFQLVR